MLTPPQTRLVVQTAVAAPSVHNTQPWLFSVDGDRLSVHADGRRALPHQDPLGRELLISCGAAVLQAELAVQGLGWEAEVILLPEADRPEVVAHLRPGAACPPSDQVLRLLAQVPHRHTDRGSFADWPVPHDVVDRLVDAAAAEQAWLKVLTTADMLELALLQAHAQADLLSDQEALRERAEWARTTASPTDGMPADLVPGWATMAPGAVRRSGPPVPEVVLVLGTQDDDRLAWVRAGRALARVLLEATAAGLVAAPATLALEMPTVRTALAGVLALHGSPQMVLRTGFPAGLAPARTGRRPVEDVLVPAGSAGA